MYKKILMATVVATSMTANAEFGITGDYEGTWTDGGAATFAQDLDLTLVGSTEGAKVTVMMEDLTGGSTVTTNKVFVEAGVEGLDLKAGNYKTQNGSGVLQKKSAVANQFEIGTDVAGFGVSVGQVSGDGNATVDASVTVAGVDLSVQNVANSDRFVTAKLDVAGVDLTTETQNTSVGRNTAFVATTTAGGFDVTGVMIDVNDATVITQDDGVLGDISDATNGKDLNGVVVTTASTLGTVTGKYINKNDATTYVGKLERGIMEYAYSKTENVDGVASVKLKVTF